MYVYLEDSTSVTFMNTTEELSQRWPHPLLCTWALLFSQSEKVQQNKMKKKHATYNLHLFSPVCL